MDRDILTYAVIIVVCLIAFFVEPAIAIRREYLHHKENKHSSEEED